MPFQWTFVRHLWFRKRGSRRKLKLINQPWININEKCLSCKPKSGSGFKEVKGEKSFNEHFKARIKMFWIHQPNPCAYRKTSDRTLTVQFIHAHFVLCSVSMMSSIRSLLWYATTGFPSLFPPHSPTRWKLIFHMQKAKSWIAPQKKRGSSLNLN